MPRGISVTRRSDWSDEKTKTLTSLARPAIYSKKYHQQRMERLSKRYDEMHPEEHGHKVRDSKRASKKYSYKIHSTRRRSTGKQRAVKKRSVQSRSRRTTKKVKNRYSQLM